MKRKADLGLRGPMMHDAERIVRHALTFNTDQAQALSDIWELDTHPDYTSYCSIVAKALDAADRSLPLGWFEAQFADLPWVDSTKALHAIADAVMATLASDLVPSPIIHALRRPWTQMNGGDEDNGRRFLLNEIIYT